MVRRACGRIDQTPPLQECAMKYLLILIFAPLIALALLYFLFPGRLVALMRSLVRRRGRLVRKSIAVDGRVWPYLEGGDPSKPALVMVHGFGADKDHWRSEEHTSELQSLMRKSYADFCLKKKKHN